MRALKKSNKTVNKSSQQISGDNTFITRIDALRNNKNTHGWEVRFRRQRGVLEEFFSDSTYGGMGEALKEARKFRDANLNEFPKLNRKEIAEIRKKNNPNEKVGVSLVKQTDHRSYGVYEYYYYQAYWSPSPGVHKCRRFSVNKYGEEESFKLACKVRDNGLKEMQ